MKHMIYPCKICTKLFKTNTSYENHIMQVDGNQSCSDSNSDLSLESIQSFHLFRDSDSSPSSFDDTIPDNIDEEEEFNIPVITNSCNISHSDSTPPPWYDVYHPSTDYRIPIRKRIQSDNRLIKSNLLPIIAVSNVRSLWPKVKHFSEDIHERDIGLALLTEVWQKKDKKRHIFEIEKLLKMEGLKYISTTRPSGKRGGGAAIVADMKKFYLEKLEILIPYNLEIVWGLLRPRSDLATGFKEIIAVSFYCPPRSPKKSKLLDHILTTVHMLLSKYPNAGLIIGGDKNDLNISSLIAGIPRVRQIVTKNTHKSKILDIIITNLHQFYQVPEIVPPVQPDDPTRGVPSDHSTPLALPVSADNHVTREYRTATVRPLPESGIELFNQWMTTLNWEPMLTLSDEGVELTPTEQVEKLQSTIEKKLNEIFPMKTIKTSCSDKPFITSELKKLDRKKKKEYRKKGRSEKYLRLQSEFQMKYKKAAKKYIEKNSTALKNENPGKAFATLRKMGAQPGDCGDEGSFSLQNHIDANMSVEECTEAIANHFSAISQEYPPLSIANLPADLQFTLSLPIDQAELPIISEEAVYKKMKTSKKSKSGVPGDVPRALINECSSELSVPVCRIFQNILKTFQWPKQWRMEYGVPLQKVSNPKDEDQLRVISLTSYYSKLFESFVIDWLMDYVGDKLDWAQYGGLKGNSINHYLIELTNFILYNQDMKHPHAVLTMCIDFSKAFNRQNHNTLIKILSDLNVPSWLLKIIMAFLSDRELILRYKGKLSQSKSLPGGTPQGTRLGMFLFLILINFAGYESHELQHNIGSVITKPLRERKPVFKAHMKFIDDLSYAHALNLRKCLTRNTDTEVQHPLSFHERTGHVLSESENILQQQALKLKKFANEMEMKINQQKSKVMLFNTSRSYDFKPKISIDGIHDLEVVEEMKLLGVVFQSNMKWYANSANVCKNGYSRLWMLRNLKRYGAGVKDLLDVYIKQCRCVLEMTAPVWSAGITVSESKQIERVQKAAFSIILGKNYVSYEQALAELKMETLEHRRKILCKKFAEKSQKHPKFSSWFELSDDPMQNKFNPVTYRTKRYKNSPLPYLTSLLNE